MPHTSQAYPYSSESQDERSLFDSGTSDSRIRPENRLEGGGDKLFLRGMDFKCSTITKGRVLSGSRGVAAMTSNGLLNLLPHIKDPWGYIPSPHPLLLRFRQSRPEEIQD